MLVLKPIVHETIWGGSKLTPYSGSNCKKIGHLYSVFHSPDLSNGILNGSWRDRTLGEYFEENKVRLHLGGYPAFPLVIALVEAADHLSIQVHPDDQCAQMLAGIPRGKNESWYFLKSPGEGRIFNGCKCRTIEELEDAIKKGRLEETVNFLAVREGDYVYVEGGTLHALSAGSFVYEIEENVEITYRFYDFGRIGPDGKRRPLQIEEALKAVHPGNKSSVKRYENGPIQERLYVTQKYEDIQGYKNESDTVECLTILDGTTYVEQEDMTVRMGQTILLEPGEILSAQIKAAIVARPNVHTGGQHAS